MIVDKIESIPPRNGRRGLVPTMGALHEGHLSLIRRAREENDEVAVSVFVNPTQFGPNEDFERYPRRLARDAELAIGAGASWIFAPGVEEMYPSKSTSVVVKGVTDTFEGAQRPGHFDGVATVVLKLFNIVRPDVSYFGLKDLQQCRVIRRMVDDLNVPVALHFCETVREADGLAMSSRNAYLSAEQRSVAPTIHRELTRLRSALLPSALPVAIERELEFSRESLREVGFQVDYLNLIDLDTMHPATAMPTHPAVVVAARIGTTRLIDNVVF